MTEIKGRLSPPRSRSHGHVRSRSRGPYVRITDVTKPIIGVDFLAHYDLLVDIRNRKLTRAATRLSASGKAVTEEKPSVNIVTGSTNFYKLLTRFPEITCPDGNATVKHKTVHFIKKIPGQPVAYKPRSLAPDKLQAAKKEFDAMLKLGIARPSKSCWSFPSHMVPKQGDERRPCGDYRGLNARTEPDRYPVCHIHDFSQSLTGTKVFCTIDLVKAFHQIPVTQEDICKKAIAAPFCLFEFQFMTFGLSNTAQIFQWFIDELLQNLDFC